MEFYIEQLYAIGQELECSFPHPKYNKLPKSERLMHIITKFGGPFTFSDVQYRAPDISQIYIRQFLSDWVSEGRLDKSGNTKNISYSLSVPELRMKVNDLY